jgi:hypothetical protein
MAKLFKDKFDAESGREAEIAPSFSTFDGSKRK